MLSLLPFSCRRGAVKFLRGSCEGPLRERGLLIGANNLTIKKKRALVLETEEIFKTVVFISPLARLVPKEGFNATLTVVPTLQYTKSSNASHLTTSFSVSDCSSIFLLDKQSLIPCRPHSHGQRIYKPHFSLLMTLRPK
jgi:hypothetical protein